MKQFSPVLFFLFFVSFQTFGQRTTVNYIYFEEVDVDKFFYTCENPREDNEEGVTVFSYTKGKQKFYFTVENEYERALTAPVGMNNAENTEISDSLVSDINNQSKVVKLVFRRSTSSYHIHTVLSASMLSFEGPKCIVRNQYTGFAFDTTDLNFYDNLALNKAENTVYYDVAARRMCLRQYKFTCKSQKNRQFVSELEIIPSVGVVYERTGTDKTQADDNEVTLSEIGNSGFADYVAKKCNQTPVFPDDSTPFFDPSNTPLLKEYRYGNITVNISCPELLGYGKHVVQRGDNLYGISRTYGVPVKILAKWNDIQDVNVIEVCQEIWYIPPPGEAPVVPIRELGETKIYGKIIDQRKLYPYDLDGQALVGSGSTTGAGGIKPLKVGKGQAATSGRNGSSGSYSTPVLIHKTVKDNRLSAIATELGYSARELASLNNMKEDEIVKAGTELKVPRKKDEDDLDFEITPVEHIEKNYDEYNVYEWYDWDEAELDSTYYMNMEANTKTKLKQYSQAASIYEDIRLTHERKLVKNYRNYTIDLYNLANVYKLQKRYSKAEAIYLEIQSILETVYGPTDPGYVKNLNDLASLQHEQGKYSSAEQMKVRAVAMVHDQLSSAIMYSSERDMAGYLHYELDRLKDIPSYLYSGHYGANMKGAAYNDALFQKGFLQTVAQRLNLLSADIPEADSLKKLLKRYRNDLYKERLKEIDKRINAPQLEEKIDELERSITLKITGNKEPVSLVQWQEVQSALKPNEAAIEFLRFPVLLPRKTDSVMYAALIIRPGTDSPEFIPLFEERDLAALLKTNGSTNTSSLYGGVDRGFVKSGSNKKISLYQLIWNPVSQSLKDVETIYYSSAGLLYRINIGAICIAPKTMLSHQYKFVQLGSTRQIVSSDDSALKNRYAVLMGGIQYEADSTAIQAAIGELDQLAVQNIRGGQYYFQSDSTGRYIERWNSLEFTEMETADISAILENAGYHTNRLSGYKATEEVFHVMNAKGGSPRVLHIATHGFFLPAPKESGAESQNNVYKRSENPLIRSGIILAGGNHAWATGEPVKPGLEDGILTAYEISQINLSNTELVVLSACETGLGDIQGNEGVYGLQRALKIAGVRYLVMSLWKVPDEQTAEFMKRFYQNWLEKGMTIPDAFRLTQHEMRERFINPHSWAGFVLIE